MEELTKDNVDILDKILHIALKEGVASPNNLPPLSKGFLSESK